MLESFQQTSETVLPAFFIIAVGYAYNMIRRGEVDSLADIVMRIVVPAFVFSHLLRSDIDLKVFNTVFISAWVVILGGGILSFAVLRKVEGHSRGVYLPVMFMNSVNLPFPIILAAYGEQAIPYALMFYLASIIGVFTIGMILVAGPESIHRVFREPVLYILGLAIYMKIQNIEIYHWLETPLYMLETSAIPLVLLVLGMQLALVRPSRIKLTLIASACRFGFGAVLGLLCVWIFGFEGLARKVVILESVMPAAVISYIVSKKFGSDAELVASIVFITTFAAMFIIPLTLVLLG